MFTLAVFILLILSHPPFFIVDNKFSILCASFHVDTFPRLAHHTAPFFSFPLRPPTAARHHHPFVLHVCTFWETKVHAKSHPLSTPTDSCMTCLYPLLLVASKLALTNAESFFHVGKCLLPAAYTSRHPIRFTVANSALPHALEKKWPPFCL